MRDNQRERLGANKKPGVHQGKPRSELVGGQRAARSKKTMKKETPKRSASRTAKAGAKRTRVAKGRTQDGQPPRGRAAERAKARVGERSASRNKPRRGGTKAMAAPTGRRPIKRRTTKR
jgi:hypothetical protein